MSDNGEKSRKTPANAKLEGFYDFGKRVEDTSF